MRQEWEQNTTLTREIARLHEIQLTPTERGAAIEQLRRGERVAATLLTIFDAARFFSSTVMSTVEIAARHAGARYRGYRLNKHHHRPSRIIVAGR